MEKDVGAPIAPCTWSCPVQTDAASYVSLIAQGKFREAYREVRRTNPLAAICSWVCTAPCEEVCCRSELDSPIAIRALKRFLTDRFENGSGEEVLNQRGSEGPRRERVAVIGSGPAGLSCARELAREGYRVTIFEASPVAGGMLRLAIPSARLPTRVVEREVSSVLALGVELLTNTRLGREMTLGELWIEGFAAVFLAVGAGHSQDSKLGVKGDARLLYAAEFLRDVNLGSGASSLGRTAIIAGAAVLPGAGRSGVVTGEQLNLQRRLTMMQALDVAHAAQSAGATQVTICTVESKGEWPASQGEVEQASREGIRFRYRVVAERVIAEGDSPGVELLGVSRIFDEEGHFAPIYQLGRRKVMRADSVIVVAGRMADLACLSPSDGVAAHEGRVIVDPDTLATTAPRVFAGGDAAFGPRDVVSAIADGRRAAASIDVFLRGKGRAQGEWRAERELEPFPCPSADGDGFPQWGDDLTAEFGASVEISEAEARREALRCLHCPQFEPLG